MRIMVTGASGFLGRHVVEALAGIGAEVVPVSRRTGYDLRNEGDALSAMLVSRPDIVVHLAATVGGIGANMASPAVFFRDNMAMGMNMIEAAVKQRARLVMLGTVCSYPKDCPIPFKEESYWEGYPEPTNAPYGIAKKALHVMCKAYRDQYGLTYSYLVPCNLYGPGDNFNDQASHVIPAMIKRFVEAREQKREQVHCWGTGKATRSFLYAPDAAKAIASACATPMTHEGVINLPGTEEIAMSALAAMVADACRYTGRIEWDAHRPDGQPRRMVDGELAGKVLGWRPETSFKDGLRATVAWFEQTVGAMKA